MSVLNVSVTLSEDAMKRLLYACGWTGVTLSVVESTPLPNTVVVVANAVDVVSGL